jgi:hypothetical protein
LRAPGTSASTTFIPSTCCADQIVPRRSGILLESWLGTITRVGRARRPLRDDRPQALPSWSRIMVVKILPNDKNNPPGKLADAELHFTSEPLDGLKLVGFGIWERRGGNGRNVTFPARQYSVNGERRSFALLRPVADANAQDRVRDLIIQAYAEHEERAAIAS